MMNKMKKIRRRVYFDSYERCPRCGNDVIVLHDKHGRYRFCTVCRYKDYD